MKIAFTGTQGTGKTTSCFDLAKKMKIEHPNKRVTVFHENASQAPKGQFNKNGSIEGQLWMFTSRVCKEIELTNLFDIVICDRTILDHIAYCYQFKQEDIARKMFDLSFFHLDSYDKIYFKLIKNNDYLFDVSHRDSKDLDYRQNIENLLIDVYKSAGLIGTDKFEFV